MARTPGKRIVGVCFALTDFAYWLFLTDLGVDREYTHLGIGKALLTRAHLDAGGSKDIAIYTCVNDNAISFYKKLGLKQSTDVMELNNIDWTPFTVE